MKLTQEQTDAILKKLNDYQLAVIDVEDIPAGLLNLPEVEEEYFNEKVNEALEE